MEGQRRGALHSSLAGHLGLEHAVREHDRFLVVTHENPDGDALGSLLATTLALRQLGKDAEMVLMGEAPLPSEYHFLSLDGLLREPPDDMDERVLVAVDCAKADRIGPDLTPIERAQLVLDIDHHHDNTRFGDVNLVDTEASCTAEILFDLADLLGAEITAEIAGALYVALVTDTGRFMYENTDARSHRMAAALIEAGVDVNDTYRRLYERVPLEKLRLISRALEHVERHEDGRLATTYISAEDYSESGASELHSEGVIDFLRALEGTKLAAVVRDKADGEAVARKVSLRSTDGSIDVSAIARKHGGGGHPRAAGFSTDTPYEELVTLLRAEV
jgi:phosphoesterase RecJ-like protein